MLKTEGIENLFWSNSLKLQTKKAKPAKQVTKIFAKSEKKEFAVLV